MEPADYVELLGLYLGDGCISTRGRTFSFRLSLDESHPKVLGETKELLERCFPLHPVHVVRVPGSRVVVLHLHSNHFPCLFPQHGPGKKHKRRIVLEPWQAALVEREPWQLLKGLLRSDGCVFVNRTGRYSYLSYDFSNESQDLLELFVDTCARVGVETRRYPNRVRVYRRSSVALLAANVGAKG